MPFINVELKEDSPEKLAAAAGKPTENFLFAAELNLIVSKIERLATLLIPKTLNQNKITFENYCTFFGTASAPRTGALTFDLLDSVVGGVSICYYNNATFDMPLPWLIVGEFVPSELNIIYFTLDNANNVIANIIGAGSTLGTPSATAPTITVTDPIFDPDAPSATAPTITVTNP